MFVYIGVCFRGVGECWMKNCLLAQCFWKEIQGIFESSHPFTPSLKPKSFGHESKFLNLSHMNREF